MPTIRPTTPADIPAIAAIYGEAVRTGTASWELEPPDAAEMERRRADIFAKGYPYIVAEEGGEILGYAYVSAYRPRRAYRFTVENSIYVAPSAHRRGVGRLLLSELIDDCTRRGFRQMIAVIGDSGNLASRKLHASLGFSLVGVAPALGYKFGHWLDQVLMQRALGEGEETPPQDA